MTKAELVAAIAKDLNVTKASAVRHLNSTLAVITKTLKKGDPIPLDNRGHAMNAVFKIERYPLNYRMGLLDGVMIEVESERSSQIGGVEVTREAGLGLVQKSVADVDRRERQCRLDSEQHGQKTKDSDRRQPVGEGEPPVDPGQSRS